MNRSTIIIVAAGFGFALLAALAVQMISGKKAPTPSETAATISVLVASKDIKMGEDLSGANMQWIVWPETSKFEGAVIRDGVQKPDEALTGRARRAVSKGEPLSSNVVIADAKASLITGALTPGYRAITVNINAQTGIAGFVNPGDNVDVLLTYEVKVPGAEKIRNSAALIVNKLASETILENLHVLAVDQDTKKTDPKIGKTVTLEATPKDAETLSIAMKMGTISLVLRPIGDDKPSHPIVDGKAPQITTDLRTSGVMREILKGQNNTGSLSQVVRVYSGSHVDNVEVRPYTP